MIAELAVMKQKKQRKKEEGRKTTTTTDQSFFSRSSWQRVSEYDLEHDVNAYISDLFILSTVYTTFSTT